MSIPTTSVSALPDDAVLVDVREDDEWAAGHAPNAIHIPLG
ncbi:MAG: rhodanese-like domain-containing protein, partial [Terrabacter sp.]